MASARASDAGEKGIVAVEPLLLQAVDGHRLAHAAPHDAGQRGGDVLRQAHGLADLAHGAAAAIGDDGGGEAGAVPAVALVDVLDDLLAALMLEIDVDVGRLLAFLGDEALEEKVDGVGIDVGDAEAVADRGIGSRAAALAEDRLVAGAGEIHDVVDGEEVGGDGQPFDERELMDDGGPDLSRNAFGITLGGSLPGEGLEMLLGRRADRDGFVGIFVAKLVEGKAAGVGDRERAGHGLLMALEEAQHLGGRLQMALGIGLEAVAGRGDGAFLANAGEDILQGTAVGMVIEDVVGGDERGFGEAGESG